MSSYFTVSTPPARQRARVSRQPRQPPPSAAENADGAVVRQFTQHAAVVGEINTLIVDFLGNFTLLIPNVQTGPVSAEILIICYMKKPDIRSTLVANII